MPRDRIFVTEKDKVYDEPGRGRVEYVRAEPIREAFPPRIWQVVAQTAMRTPGISTLPVNRAREILEGGQDA